MKDLEKAADVYRKLLNGGAPNGVSPEDCGDYADAVDAVYWAHDTGGTEEVRAVWNNVRGEYPELAREVAGGQKDKKDKKDKKDSRRAIHERPLPPAAIDLLPDTLRIPAQMIDVKHERDVFVTGALPVCAGALANVRFFYGGQWLSLNLNAAVIAPPSSGKGKFRLAKQLGAQLDSYLYEESQRAIQTWKDRKDAEGDDPGPRPLERTMFLPGDSSAAAMKQHLKANPQSVLFETEFKTVGTVLSQDWGQFRDVLLKSFHNEAVTVSRKGEDLLRIGHPALSVALSGTPGTFCEIIEDVEDGLFSRFCLYGFQSEPRWRSQFGQASDHELADEIGGGAGRLLAMHKALVSREEPLYIKFGEAEQETIDRAGELLLDTFVSIQGREELHANIYRAAVVACRIAGVCALLRMNERGASLRTAKSVTVSARDVRAGLYLAFTYFEHAMFVARMLSSTNERSGLSAAQREYLDSLPGGAFRTSEAYEVAGDLGIGERKARRWLKKFAKVDLLVDRDHGEWERPAQSSSGVLSVLSVLFVLFDREDADMQAAPTVESGGAPF
jgi:hypothetical protein